MSSYIQFFVKKGEVRLPIGTFSRSNKIYQLFYDALGNYGRFGPIKLSDILAIKDELTETIQKYSDMIAEGRNDIELTIKANNDLDSKFEKIAEIRQAIHETEEELRELRNAAGYLYALREIIEEAEYMDGFNPDEYLWCGIDAAWEDEKGDEEV